VTSPLTDHQLNTRAIRQLLVDVALPGARRRRIHKLLDDNDLIADELAACGEGDLAGQTAVFDSLFDEREED
jgi:hypothetical protein